MVLTDQSMAWLKLDHVDLSSFSLYTAANYNHFFLRNRGKHENIFTSTVYDSIYFLRKHG